MKDKGDAKPLKKSKIRLFERISGIYWWFTAKDPGKSLKRSVLTIYGKSLKIMVNISIK